MYGAIWSILNVIELKYMSCDVVGVENRSPEPTFQPELKGTELIKLGRPYEVERVDASVGRQLKVSPLIVEYPREVKLLIDTNIAFWVVIVENCTSPTPKNLILD